MLIQTTDLLRYYKVYGIVLIQLFIQDVESAEYCSGYYSETCEHGCCGTGTVCCYNKVALALGLTFGLLALIALGSGFLICFIQYRFRKRKKVTTMDAFVQTGDPTSGTFVKPSPLPPIFQLQKRIGKQTKRKGEINLAIDDDIADGEKLKLT